MQPAAAMMCSLWRTPPRCVCTWRFGVVVNAQLLNSFIQNVLQVKVRRPFKMMQLMIYVVTSEHLQTLLKLWQTFWLEYLLRFVSLCFWRGIQPCGYYQQLILLWAGISYGHDTWSNNLCTDGGAAVQAVEGRHIGLALPCYTDLPQNSPRPAWALLTPLRLFLSPPVDTQTQTPWQQAYY